MSQQNKSNNTAVKSKKKFLIPEENRSIIRETIEIVLLTLILIIGIKNILGEPRWIPTESMVPTLIEGDRVFIEKMSQFSKDYKRGDILVFYPPEFKLKHDPVSEFTRAVGFMSNDIAYIKRLIGLPGDVLEVKEGLGVFINGKLLDEPYVNEIARYGSCSEVKYCGPLKLGKDEYFMMGDNRNNSSDSRVWGPLKGDRIIGKDLLTWWPINRINIVKRPEYTNNKSD